MEIDRKDQQHDAIVVGGGLIGLSCAWRLAQRGLDVCLLDRDRPGSGASGVAAGMLAPVTEAEFGAEALLGLNLAAARAYPAFVAEIEDATGLPTGYGRCGSLQLALDRDEAEELRRLHGFQASLGLESEWLAPGECRRLEPGLATRLSGGVYVPDEAQVDPQALLAALAAALEAASGTIATGVEATGPLTEGARVVGVRTADGGRRLADEVVLAAGSWSGEGAWGAAGAGAIRPVKGQIIRLRAPEPLAAALVRTPWVYVVSRPEGEVVIGATVEERGFDTAVTAGGVHELLREAYRVLPDVAELELVELAAGLRPGTPDNAPLIGRVAEGLTLATGHYRNGALLAPTTADAVAAIVAGEAPDARIEPFDPLRFESKHRPDAVAAGSLHGPRQGEVLS